MPRYTLEYRAPKQTKWHALTVSSAVPFTDQELAAYKQRLAEHTTELRCVAIFAHQIELRVLQDGTPMPADALAAKKTRDTRKLRYRDAGERAQRQRLPQAIYRAKDQWVLCTCNECNTLNYVEPHGTIANCSKCKREMHHSSIPYEFRDVSGCWLIKPVTRST